MCSRVIPRILFDWPDVMWVVLGAMLIDKKGVDEVIDILHKEAFYVEAHQHIFEAIYDLFQETKPIDILTVSNLLKQKNKLEKVGGDYYLIDLSRAVGSSAHIEFHARIILQKFVQRSLIKISTEIIEEAYGDNQDVFDLLEQRPEAVPMSFEEFRRMVMSGQG